MFGTLPWIACQCSLRTFMTPFMVIISEQNEIMSLNNDQLNHGNEL